VVFPPEGGTSVFFVPSEPLALSLALTSERVKPLPLVDGSADDSVFPMVEEPEPLVLGLTLDRDEVLPLVDGTAGASIFPLEAEPEARSSAFTCSRVLAADGSLELEFCAYAACAANSNAGMINSLFIVNFLD